MVLMQKEKKKENMSVNMVPMMGAGGAGEEKHRAEQSLNTFYQWEWSFWFLLKPLSQSARLLTWRQLHVKAIDGS